MTIVFVLQVLFWPYGSTVTNITAASTLHAYDSYLECQTDMVKLQDEANKYNKDIHYICRPAPVYQ